MTEDQVLERIREIGIVPVVRALTPQQALGAAEAVSAGGIPIVEITMTVPGAVQVIAQLAREGGKDLLIGAGTVLDKQAARQCLDAGAQFIVSPGFDGETVELVRRAGIVMMAAGLTPTEVITAWKAGSALVKVFPCGLVGGPKYIRALRGPLPQIPLVPTGGVNLENAGEFIRAGAAALGVGGELVAPDALRVGDYQLIAQSAREFLARVEDARAQKQPAH
ncbi:MAG TPA: bifunctional 4-hydroxy-2-oxoglutarate aldolase/2-dehydro-3-deoxy-phosphogluconate aldolase [Candidatus Cybelea sp.]|nr:bifunctional 4-hydroxy-2-oxoglutarate aldolase/2-dehydro-3-deoxy-phosphogluconate aldolase [Candidatus Cybelea sp.]